MGRQTFVIRIEEDLARKVSQLLASRARGYSSLDELVHVALQNQLGIEEAEEALPPESATRAIDQIAGSALLMPSEKEPPLNLAHPQAPSSDRLFVLTNRLSPIKVAVRVLARLGAEGEWPALEDFQEKAAKIARHVGLELRKEDLASRKRGQARRWVAYPIGDDERAAYSRFVTSFTMQVNDGKVLGPMIILGLGNVKEGRAALTEAGWRLATAPSPTLDGAEGLTFSMEEAAILRRQVLDAPGEREAVREFLQIVKRAAGSQLRIDELLAARYPDWTETLTVAHRSALIGRLSDLDVVEVTGRGPNAKLRLLAHAEEFWESTNGQGVA